MIIANLHSYLTTVISKKKAKRSYKVQTNSNPNKQTIIILGAAGRIGDAAAKAFLEAGWRVKGVARNAKAATLRTGIEAVQADAYDRQSLIEAVKGADVILNALNPKYTQWETTVMRLAENVMAAAEASGALHLFPGNVYNYGHVIGINMNEESAQVPSTVKARIRMEAEELFRTNAQSGGVKTVILRGGDYFGGSKPESWLDLLILKNLKKDIFTWPGPANMPHAFAYLPDFARAFVAVAEKRAALKPFESFNFQGHTMTGAEMHTFTQQAVGRTLHYKTMGWTMPKLLGLVIPMMRELVIMSYLWRTPHSLNGEKLRRFIGPLQSTPTVEALREAIRDMHLDRG
jgi:nucleoside-diphosphate-sugar epimerase